MAATSRTTVLTDTQIVIMAFLGEPLPRKVQALLANPETDRLISAASLVEIAIKSASGKIAMTETDLRNAIRDLALTPIPFTPQHALQLFKLPLHHRDPFDRMIIATALSERIPLIGSDRQFKRYPGLKVIW